MPTMAENFAALIRAEGLDDLNRLLTPREWDEVPLFSRTARIRFLAGLDVREQSRLLVTTAVAYLARVLDYAIEKRRDDVVVMVSVLHWEDLKAKEPEPVSPKFWICTNPARDLGRFRLQPGASEEAALVAEWLGTTDLLGTCDVFDSFYPVTDPDLRRVYVARRLDPRIEPLIQRP